MVKGGISLIVNLGWGDGHGYENTTQLPIPNAGDMLCDRKIPMQ